MSKKMETWKTKIEILQNGKIYIKCNNIDNSYYVKFWVAEILGTDQDYIFKRKYINDEESAVIEKDGVYEIYKNCIWYKRPEHYFIKVENGSYTVIDKQTVLSMF